MSETGISSQKENSRNRYVKFEIENDDTYLDKESERDDSDDNDDKDKTPTDTDSSEEYDTDLDDAIDSIKRFNKVKENEFGEHDEIIGRQKYIQSCTECSCVPPQRRILDELENKHIRLSNRSLGPDAIRPLCVALVDNLRVENLLLDGCGLGDEGCIYVSQVLLDNIVICRLNLSNNGIGCDAARYLSLALATNKTLLHLNLSENKLNDAATYILTSGLARNVSLLSFNLSKNVIGVEGGKALGTSLIENTRLQELDLSWNDLTGTGAVGVLKALVINSTLHTINLSWNGISYEGSVALSKALQSNTTLTSIDVSNNRINWRGAFVISKGLKINTTLQVFKIGDNPLTTTGAMDIVQAVSNDCSVVRDLDLANVAILGETELLGVVIQRKRKFHFMYGGVVRTHDVLGQRKEKEITAMERLLDYMKSLGIRPIELLRAFDKNVMFKLSKAEFIRRLKKTGVKLYKYEMEALADTIASGGVEGRGISYSKLVESVNLQILNERNRKIAERKQRQTLRAYHKRILDLKLPAELVSESEEELVAPTLSRPSTVMTFASARSLPHLSKDSDKHHLLSIVPKPKPLSKKVSLPTFSMCDPLGGPQKKSKYARKKKTRKRKGPREVTTWMSADL